jgi:uncharacterized membrane protein
MRAESVHAALLVLVVAGLGLSCFATYETLNPSVAQVCSPTHYISCSAVDGSGHTMTLGVPDWLIGVAGFVLLLAIDVPLYLTWRRELLTGLVAVSGLGLAVAVYLAVIELTVINALCPVCFSTYVVVGLVFLLSLRLFLSSRGADSEDVEETKTTDETSPNASTSA